MITEAKIKRVQSYLEAVKKDLANLKKREATKANLKHIEVQEGNIKYLKRSILELQAKLLWERSHAEAQRMMDALKESGWAETVEDRERLDRQYEYHKAQYSELIPDGFMWDCEDCDTEEEARKLIEANGVNWKSVWIQENKKEDSYTLHYLKLWKNSSVEPNSVEPGSYCTGY